MNSATRRCPSASVYSIVPPSVADECRSKAALMLTSASSENRDVLPRSRSLMRGCVRPHSWATFCCVQPLAAICALILAIISSRTRVVVGSGADREVSDVARGLGVVIRHYALSGIVHPINIEAPMKRTLSMLFLLAASAVAVAGEAPEPAKVLAFARTQVLLDLCTPGRRAEMG